MASVPDVGATAPDFTLPSTRGEITLSNALQKGAVLLVFYPGDDTPVCTKQLCNYRDNLGVFGDLGVQVIAINPQSQDSHRKFADKHQFPFPVVSDADKVVCKAVRRDQLSRHGQTRPGAGGPRRQDQVAQDRLPDLPSNDRRH